MLRCGDKLRLTASEREFVSVAAGRDVNPTSVDEYNRLVDSTHEILVAQADAAEVYMQPDGVDLGEGPELRIMAALLQATRLEEG
ncbi:hypothetical protein [Roseateles sp.]|uniref:hypothetical protein n=1 Tax=Roseateles sp. TaxID=1971397 RepID=UPI0039EA0C9C